MIDPAVDSGIGRDDQERQARAIATAGGISAGLAVPHFARAAEGVDRAVDGVDVWTSEPRRMGA